MRIILANRYYHPDESATSRVTTSFARALARDGHDVHVITGARLHDDPGRVLASGSDGAVQVHRLPTSGMGRRSLLGRALDYATFHLAFAWRCARLARRGDVVVVCTDPPLLSVTAMAAARGARRVNWLFDLYPEVATDLGVLRPTSFAARLAFTLRDASLRSAILNVAPMASMAAHLARRGVDPSTLAVVHSWSEGEAIRPIARERNVLRREWGLQDKFVVGYSGNLGRAHEFDTMLDAAARLRGRGDIVFMFIGAGHRRADVEARARRMGLANVRFQPLQPRARLADTLGVPDLHLISLRPEMEAFVIPSKFYGIAAAGRPSVFVGAPDGEIARILARGECGLSVAIGDDPALATAILSLADDGPRRTRMGEAARRVFDAGFDERHGVETWRALLSGLSRELPAAPPRASVEAPS